MPKKNIHERAFDEGTITKLELFDSYLKSWLPVFIHSKPEKDIIICDFFAGPGRDIVGVDGSPIRFLKTIYGYKDDIIAKKKKSHYILMNLMT